MASKVPNGLTETQKRLWMQGQKAVDAVVAFHAPEIPKLSQGATCAAVIEELGPIKAFGKGLEKTENILKERMKALIPYKLDTKGKPTTVKEKEVRAENYKMEVRSSTRVALNQQAAKALLLELNDFEPKRLLQALRGEITLMDAAKKMVEKTIDPGDGTEPYVMRVWEEGCLDTCMSETQVDAMYVEAI